MSNACTYREATAESIHCHHCSEYFEMEVITATVCYINTSLKGRDKTNKVIQDT